MYHPFKEDLIQGDSGGPLFHSIEGGFEQIGVVSYGKGCGTDIHPVIFTR